MDFEPLILQGLLRKIPPSRDLMEKEMRESEMDLQESEKEFRAGGYKWGTIKAYYAMFHKIPRKETPLLIEGRNCVSPQAYLNTFLDIISL